MTAFSVPATNVIVVGASAGGIGAVRTLLNKLPEKVPAAIFVAAPPDYPLIIDGRYVRLTRGPGEPPSPFTCPGRSESLWEIEEKNLDSASSHRGKYRVALANQGACDGSALDSKRQSHG